jgi:hypothetical protein
MSYQRLNDKDVLHWFAHCTNVPILAVHRFHFSAQFSMISSHGTLFSSPSGWMTERMFQRAPIDCFQYIPMSLEISLQPNYTQRTDLVVFSARWFLWGGKPLLATR